MVLGLVSLFVIPTVYYKKVYSCSGISEYDAKIDRKFILDLFQKNMYWLVAENVTDFSAEYVLDTKSRSKRPEDYGNLSIYVHRTSDCKPTGFVAFYKKSFFKGYVLFLVVDEVYRGKGYAKKLLTFSLDKLKEMGCSYAELVTRTSNEKAQKLYKSVGMHEVWRDEGFVKFEKQI